jgi:2-polyprenyl-3-methyl-5-hydroxy-6-metoxy-1,4-benzoquinol methylase
MDCATWAGRYTWGVHNPYAGDIPLRAKIPWSCAPDHALATQRHLRFATGRLGVSLPPGAKILDFGCGIGSSVSVLLGLGYDAFGVDVLEY